MAKLSRARFLRIIADAVERVKRNPGIGFDGALMSTALSGDESASTTLMHAYADESEGKFCNLLANLEVGWENYQKTLPE